MKKCRVTLAAEERGPLYRLLARGKADVRKLKHARILLRADAAAGAPGWGDERTAAGTTIEWQFTTEDARIKPRSLYPSF